MSRDPIGELGGLSLYGFVGNDPVASFDLLGLKISIVVLGDSISHGTKNHGRLYAGYVDFLTIRDAGEPIMIGDAGERIGGIKNKYGDRTEGCEDKVAVLAMMGMNDALSLVNDNGKDPATRKKNYKLRYNGALKDWRDLYTEVKADFSSLDPKKKVLFVTVTTPGVTKTPNLKRAYRGIVGDINRFLGSLNTEMPKTCQADGNWWSCATADASGVQHTIGVDGNGQPDASKSDDGIHFLDPQAKKIADIVSAVVNAWANGSN